MDDWRRDLSPCRQQFNLRRAKARGKKKSPVGASINLHGAALLLVHQSREHFELLRRNAFREKSDDILDARLERGEHLKRIADKVQLASETRCALKITACGSNRFAA